MVFSYTLVSENICYIGVCYENKYL